MSMIIDTLPSFNSWEKKLFFKFRLSSFFHLVRLNRGTYNRSLKLWIIIYNLLKIMMKLLIKFFLFLITGHKKTKGIERRSARFGFISRQVVTNLDHFTIFKYNSINVAECN